MGVGTADGARVQLLEALSQAACAPRYRCSPELEAAATRLLAIAALTPLSTPGSSEEAAATAAAVDIAGEVAAQEECLRRGAELLRSLFAPRYKPGATFDDMDEVLHACSQATHAPRRRMTARATSWDVLSRTPPGRMVSCMGVLARPTRRSVWRRSSNAHTSLRSSRPVRRTRRCGRRCGPAGV